MNCEKCGAALQQVAETDSLACASCKQAPNPNPANPHEPLSAVGQQTDFLCPKCPNHNLQIGDLFGTQVCFCDQCYGFVIDRVSLGELVDKLRASYGGPDDAPIQINPAELHEVCTCPACFDRMETFNYYGPGNVVLDSCNECMLTWFNQGELGKIIRAPGRRQLRKSNNYESDVLRNRLYSLADSELACGMLMLIQ